MIPIINALDSTFHTSTSTSGSIISHVAELLTLFILCGILVWMPIDEYLEHRKNKREENDGK